MYKIIENGIAKRTKYTSYETARQAVRKILRTLTNYRYHNQPDLPMSYAGFTIKKVG